MSETTSELLARLRDVQEPIPPEGVPLWLVLANVTLIGLILTLFLYRRHHRKFGWRKQLIAELQQARQQPPDKAIFIAAQLLRRLLLHRGSAVQTDSGTGWLHKLDEHFDTQWFTQGDGRVFGDNLYQAAVLSPVAISTLLDRIEVLIKALPARACEPGVEAQ